jgi:hypothetical protein
LVAAAAIKTGDGMTVAYRAGAPLKDMEFVQYHPTALPTTGIVVTEAARGEGTDGDPRIGRLDVIVTQWPPQEGVYGQSRYPRSCSRRATPAQWSLRPGASPALRLSPPYWFIA